MDELDQPLTDIEQSRADTGFRYYVCDPQTYTALASAVDASRGYPWKHTHRGLPSVDDLPDATDGSGKLIAIDCWRFTANDDAMLDGTAGVQELTQLEFLALKPPPEDSM
jgi:hypothetical protein